MNNYINDLTFELEKELNELIYPLNTKKEINNTGTNSNELDGRP
jgi:hypothetical protein